MTGRPKGSLASEKQKKAGAANLARWQKEKGKGLQRMTHGVYSSTIRKRYSDKRSREGQKLHRVVNSIVADLGGPGELNAGQQVIIASLRGKFIVVFQISDYLDKQSNIIDLEGNVLPCLRQTYLSYSESIRRDLETLYGLSRSHLRRKVPKLEEIINRNNGK